MVLSCLPIENIPITSQGCVPQRQRKLMYHGMKLLPSSLPKKLESQATVDPRVDNAIHRVNLYIGFPHTCLMDDDLPGAKCYPMFKQKQGQIICRCQRKGSTKSYLFLKSLKSGSASFCIANFFLLSKKIETLSIILKKYSGS